MMRHAYTLIRYTCQFESFKKIHWVLNFEVSRFLRVITASTCLRGIRCSKKLRTKTKGQHERKFSC